MKNQFLTGLKRRDNIMQNECSFLMLVAFEERKEHKENVPPLRVWY